MCRFVIVVIFLSCVSFVLAQVKPNVTECVQNPEVIAYKQKMKKCFNNTVEQHIKPDTTAADTTGTCHTATDFGEMLDNYIQFVSVQCNISFPLSTLNLKKFIEFSLKDDSFKNLYNDSACLKNLESDISNKCVAKNVGHFNITKETKHTSWATKARLYYSWTNCELNKDVGNCVQAVLNSCRPTTGQYMAQLFNYSRELGNCSQFRNSTIPPASGTSDAHAHWLTLPICLLAVLMHVCVQKLKCGKEIALDILYSSVSFQHWNNSKTILLKDVMVGQQDKSFIERQWLKP